MCLTCVGSQLSISSSKASNFSGPLQLFVNALLINNFTVHRLQLSCISIFTEQFRAAQRREWRQYKNCKEMLLNKSSTPVTCPVSLQDGYGQVPWALSKPSAANTCFFL
uniref:Uncharacterized protein n=1 Tax=Anas platyrhynchos platyrhynchos TaxID=8840 RepID=A0A493TGD7_ANAPP